MGWASGVLVMVASFQAWAVALTKSTVTIAAKRQGRATIKQSKICVNSMV